MKSEREWRCISSNTHYYFQTHNGLVVGQTYNVALSIVWGAKIPISATEDKFLGQYIEMEYAKRAVEKYWQDRDRVIENEQVLLD